MFKYLDKNGINASALFSNIDFSNKNKYLIKLIQNYESKFDYHFINPSLIKTTYNLDNEKLKIICQIKSEFDKHKADSVDKI